MVADFASTDIKIMLAAGEASGDLHGAALAAELLRRRPDLELFGMGGVKMREAGVKLLFNPTTLSTIGFAEALKNAHLLRRVLARFGEAIAAEKPAAVVLIDYPGFNMRLAEMAHAAGVPVAFYFSPSAWAWGRGRADRVARSAAKVLAVFPFEADVYRAAGCDVEFVGHPLLDIVPADLSRDAARRALGLPDDDAPDAAAGGGRRGRRTVALLPGSRKQEIETLLPPMLEAARLLGEGYRFVIPIAPTIDRAEVEHHINRCRGQAGLDIRLGEGLVHEALAASDLAITASGTATLEAAILGTPMIIVYRVSGSTYLLAKMVLRVPFIGLPNIVAGRVVVPELVQHEATPGKIAACARALLDDPERLAAMRRDLLEVHQRLGEPGAVGRAASSILQMASARQGRGAGQ